MMQEESDAANVLLSLSSLRSGNHEQTYPDCHIGSTANGGFSSALVSEGGELFATNESRVSEEKKTIGDCEPSSEPYIASVTMAITHDKQEPMACCEVDCLPLVTKDIGTVSCAKQCDILGPPSSAVLCQTAVNSVSDHKEAVSMTLPNHKCAKDTSRSRGQEPKDTSRSQGQEPKDTSRSQCQEPKDTSWSQGQEPKDMSWSQGQEPKDMSRSQGQEPCATVITDFHMNSNPVVSADAETNQVTDGYLEPCSDTVLCHNLPVDISHCDKCDITNELHPSTCTSKLTKDISCTKCCKHIDSPSVPGSGLDICDSAVVERTSLLTIQNSGSPIDAVPNVQSTGCGSMTVSRDSLQCYSSADITNKILCTAPGISDNLDLGFQVHCDHNYEPECVSDSGCSVGADHNYDANVNNSRLEDELEQEVPCPSYDASSTELGPVDEGITSPSAESVMENTVEHPVNEKQSELGASSEAELGALLEGEQAPHPDEQAMECSEVRTFPESPVEYDGAAQEETYLEKKMNLPDVASTTDDGPKLPFLVSLEADPEVHQADPEVQQGDPDVQQADLEVHQADLEVQQGDPEVQQGDPEVQQGDPEVQHGDLEVHQADPEVQQGDPEVQQGDLEMQQGDRDVQQADMKVHQTDLEMNQADLEVHQADPEVQQGDPDVQQADPDVLQTDMEVHQTDMEMNQADPEVHQADPEVQQADPEVQQGDQEVHQTDLEMNQADPEVHQANQEVHQTDQEVHQTDQEMYQAAGFSRLGGQHRNPGSTVEQDSDLLTGTSLSCISGRNDDSPMEDNSLPDVEVLTHVLVSKDGQHAPPLERESLAHESDESSCSNAVQEMLGDSRGFSPVSNVSNVGLLASLTEVDESSDSQPKPLGNAPAMDLVTAVPQVTLFAVASGLEHNTPTTIKYPADEEITSPNAAEFVMENTVEHPVKEEIASLNAAESVLEEMEPKPPPIGTSQDLKPTACRIEEDLPLSSTIVFSTVTHDSADLPCHTTVCISDIEHNEPSALCVAEVPTVAAKNPPNAEPMDVLSSESEQPAVSSTESSAVECIDDEPSRSEDDPVPQLEQGDNNPAEVFPEGAGKSCSTVGKLDSQPEGKPAVDLAGTCDSVSVEKEEAMVSHETDNSLSSGSSERGAVKKDVKNGPDTSLGTVADVMLPEPSGIGPVPDTISHSSSSNEEQASILNDEESAAARESPVSKIMLPSGETRTTTDEIILDQAYNVSALSAGDESAVVGIVDVDDPDVGITCLSTDESGLGVGASQPGAEPTQTITAQALTFSLPPIDVDDSAGGKSREFVLDVIQGNDGSLSMGNMVETTEGDNSSLLNSSCLESSLLTTDDVMYGQLLPDNAAVDTNQLVASPGGQLITFTDSSGCITGGIDDTSAPILQTGNTYLGNGQAGMSVSGFVDDNNQMVSAVAGDTNMLCYPDISRVVSDNPDCSPDNVNFFMDEAGLMILAQDVPSAGKSNDKVFVDRNGRIHTLSGLGPDLEPSTLAQSSPAAPATDPSTNDDASIKYFVDDKGNLHTLKVDDENTSSGSTKFMMDKSGVIHTMTAGETQVSVNDSGVVYTTPSIASSGNQVPVSILSDGYVKTVESDSDMDEDVTARYIIDGDGNLTRVSEPVVPEPVDDQISQKIEMQPDESDLLQGEPNDTITGDNDDGGTKYFMDEEGLIHALPRDQVGDSTRLFVDDSGNVHPLPSLDDQSSSDSAQVFVDENGTIHRVSSHGLEDTTDGTKLFIDEDGLIHSIPDEEPAVAAEQTKLIVDDEGKVYALPPGMQQEIPDGSRVFIGHDGKVHTLPVDESSEQQTDATKFFIDDNGGVYTLPTGAQDDIVDGRIFIDETGKMHTLPAANDDADGSDIGLLQPYYQIIGDSDDLSDTGQLGREAHFPDEPLFSNLTSSVELDLGNPRHMAAFSKSIPSPNCSPLKRAGIGTSPGRYCQVCHSKFPDMKSLVAHGLIHVKSVPQCPACGKVLSQAYVRNHLLRHLKTTVHKCNTCHENFPDKEALLSHSCPPQTVTNQCSICQRSFKYRHYLLSHFKKMHGKNNFSCRLCGEDFPTQAKRKEHKELVHKKRNFTCQTCGAEFVSKQERYLHRKEVHSTRSRIKPAGLKEIGSAEDTVDSTLSERRDVARVMECGFKCDICDIGFTDPAKLESHMNSHPGRKHHPCSQCHVSFVSRWHLRKHIKTKHFRHQCTICQKEFTGPRKLTIHMKAHAAAMMKCPVCGKELTQRQLNKHMESHAAGDEPYACACGLSFREKPDIKLHLLTHQGPKPLSCEFCNHSAADEEGLRSHMDSHIVQKSFWCPVCSAEFSTEAKISAHMQTHAPYQKNKPYVCQICDSGFSENRNLEKHMVMKHGMQCGVKRRPGRPKKISVDSDTNKIGSDMEYSIFSTEAKISAHVQTHALYQENKTCVSQIRGSGFYKNTGLGKHTVKKHGKQCGVKKRRGRPKMIRVGSDMDTFRSDVECSIRGNLLQATVTKFIPVTPPRVTQLDEDTLMQYALIDSSAAGLRCVFCERWFSKKGQIIRHLRTHPELKDEIVLAASSPAQKSLTGAQSPRNLVSCELCGKSFSQQRYLYQHMARYHDSTEGLSECAEPASQLKNRAYRKAFKKKLPYKHKYLNNYLDAKLSYNDLVNAQRKSKKRQNEASFSSRLPAKRFKLDPGNPLTCPLCSESFTDQKGLDEHIVIYMSNKRFEYMPTDQCGRADGCLRRTRISRYIQIPIYDQVYPCHMCSKGFLKKYELWNHIVKAHAGDIVSQAKSLKVKLQRIDTAGLKIKYWDGEGNVIASYSDSNDVPFNQDDASSGMRLDHDYLVEPLMAGGSNDRETEDTEVTGDSGAPGFIPDQEPKPPSADEDGISLRSTDDEAFLCHLCYSSFGSEAELEEHSLVHRDLQKAPTIRLPESEKNDGECEIDEVVRKEIQKPMQYEYSQVKRTLTAEESDGNMNCLALAKQMKESDSNGSTKTAFEVLTTQVVSRKEMSNKSPPAKSPNVPGVVVKVDTQKTVINGKMTHIEIRHIHIPSEVQPSKEPLKTTPADVHNESPGFLNETEEEESLDNFGEESGLVSDEDMEWDDDFTARMDRSADYDPDEDDPNWMEDDRVSLSADEGSQKEDEEKANVQEPSGQMTCVCPDCNEPIDGDLQVHKKSLCTYKKPMTLVKVKESVSARRDGNKQSGSMLSTGQGNEPFPSADSDRPPVFIDIVLDFI